MKTCGENHVDIISEKDMGKSAKKKTGKSRHGDTMGNLSKTWENHWDIIGKSWRNI